MSRLLPLAALLLLAVACGGESTQPQTEKRVVVFGVDGLDPEELMSRVELGMLPHFAKLIENGTFHSLQTSWPPQSPVAWSNFICGTNPGKHGLYDFIHVDRHNYGVASSMSVTDPVGIEIPLFGWKVPVTGGETRLTRAFPAFWEVLSEAGIATYVHRMPANFPPAPTKAVTFPDMGTPDLVGAASGKSYLWSETTSAQSGESYYKKRVSVIRSNERLWKVFDKINGPDDTLRNVSGLEKKLDAAIEKGDFSEANRLTGEITRAHEVTEEVTFFVDRTGAEPQLAVKIGDAWGVAGLGGWTDWMPIEFGMMWGEMMVVSGYTRFRFLADDPFEVYGAPVQIDPFNPATPISTPDSAAAELATAIGPYYTQGFPDAYKSYKAGLLDTAGFVEQSDTVLEERGRMLDYALDQWSATGGMLFFYVGSLDMRCHMLWHAADPAHPHQEEPGEFDGVPYAEQIDRVYRQVDTMLGELVAELDAIEAAGGEPIDLMVMSDHGFAPFRRKMHVNDWLVQEGYLVLKDGVTDTQMLALSVDRHGDPIPGSGPVDWAKTRAYAIGFNGIILNRVGREAEGIVTDADAPALLEELRAKLSQLRDEDGSTVFTALATASEVFSGDQLKFAPDLQLGFNVGYGASDECAIGGVTGDWQRGVCIVDNDSRWSGSHLMDPELVRGTLIVRRKVTLAKDPALEDLTATLYSRFGVAPPEGLDGRPLY
ncbi:MAG: alkaline phosphatase family protein [Planctomycetota bacterium]|nr:alkaline phosphatase family protein [Planctomycetota bacterium]